jgi:hypothetical protein
LKKRLIEKNGRKLRFEKKENVLQYFERAIEVKRPTMIGLHFTHQLTVLRQSVRWPSLVVDNLYFFLFSVTCFTAACIQVPIFRSQSYDRELQRQRSENLQRHEQPM